MQPAKGREGRTSKHGRVSSHRIDVMARATPTLSAAKTSVIQVAAIKKLDLDLAALDGLRAVACLAVICFHCLLYWGALLDLDVGKKVSEDAIEFCG